MPHILESDYFTADFLLSQFLSGNVSVLHMVWTVGAAVDAVVGQVQRCEENDAVAVEVFFDLFCQPEDFLVHFFIVAGEKDGGLPVG